MIGKISKSGSFKNLVEYLDKEDSVVLGTNMYGQGSRELTAEFMTVNDLNPGIKQPVLHASLSLSPGEFLSDEQLRSACETWMEQMGFDLNKNQYLIVRHKDTEHEHAHFAINRIDMVSGKVVVDSYERYRSQEIIRDLERNYGLEQVAPSWQTFKDLELGTEPNPELSRRQQLVASIERAAIDSPTMPEFFQRLAECQILANVSFSRTGKPKGITYSVAEQEQVAGNVLGKAYSFPGLQKYLKVNYDPSRDNQKLAELVQITRQQHSQSPQPAESSAIPELELHSRLLLPELVSDQPPIEPKTQSVLSSQYGIPALSDLIKAIPEQSWESQVISRDNDHRQLELERATYQQWAKQAKTIYRVEEPQDVDPRIAFLMHSEQYDSEQITQVLAQSSALQELLKRAHTYSQSYSEFCQSQANNNQAIWQAELDQYRRAVEIEQEQQEQQRIANERQREQEQIRLRESAARIEAKKQEREREREQLASFKSVANESEIQAVAQRLTASEILKLKRDVEFHFQVSPTNCSDLELTTAERQHSHWSKKAEQLQHKFEALEKEIEGANFFQKLLPSHNQKLEQVVAAEQEWNAAVAQSNSASQKKQLLQRVRQQYNEWEQLPYTEEMRRQLDYLQTPEGKQLIVKALSMERSRELERIQELERQVRHEATLKQLQQWYKTAQALERPAEYLVQIVKITKEWKAGTPLPDQAHSAMNIDFKEQLHLIHRKEQEQQRHSRSGDLSL